MIFDCINRLLIRGVCFFKCKSGSTAIEYALIASLIAMTIIGAVTMLGGSLSNSYDNTANAIQNS